MGDIGDALRSAREQRDITLDRAADETRIAAQFLQALENEVFDDLPAPVYVRGFIRSYASYLGIDSEPLLQKLASSGAHPGLAAPDAFVDGSQAPHPPASSDPFQATPPSPPRGVMPMDEEEFVRYEPGRGARSAGPPQTRRVTKESYGATPTPGVLTAQSGRYDDGTIPRGFAFAALAVMLVIIVGGAAYWLATGGDETQSLLPANPESSATATAVNQTVIAVDSPTPGGSGTATPAGSGAGSGSPTVAGATQAPGETQAPAPTATQAQDATAAPATSTPEATPTPTETATPAPTAPPTATPIPTPVPPGALSECSQQGRMDCGDSPYLIVCAAPGVWFIDVGRNYPLPPGWTTQSVQRLKDRANPSVNGCPP